MMVFGISWDVRRLACGVEERQCFFSFGGLAESRNGKEGVKKG